PILPARHHINPGESKAWAIRVRGASACAAGVTVLEGWASAAVSPPEPAGVVLGMLAAGVATSAVADWPPVASAVGVLVAVAVARPVSEVVDPTVGAGVSAPAGPA
ncbi:MAG: hypothetical protein IH963_15565, partial [Chloroflexi bacterium]|nr:hypothetical protein [Chloroflexota bacterium]